VAVTRTDKFSSPLCRVLVMAFPNPGSVTYLCSPQLQVGLDRTVKAVKQLLDS